MMGHLTCARAICDELRDYDPDGGRGSYCGAECRKISKEVNGPRMPVPDAWSWLPQRPGEVRVPSQR